jgi:hypothetical protein
MKYFFTARGLAYWQAGHAPAPQAGAAPDLSEEEESDLSVDGSPFSDPAPSLPSAPFFFAAPVPLFLKSVAYQPDPLSWKPAADTSFAMAAFPQLGQSVMGASLSFWRYSFSKPQLPQRYS